VTSPVPLPHIPLPTQAAFQQEQDFAARQYRGKRDNQEDYYAFADAAEPEETSLGKLLLVVGDGLGAHAGGSVASYIAVNAFVRAFHEQTGSTSWRLRTALDTANETLGYITARMPSVAPPMGTTMLAVIAAKPATSSVGRHYYCSQRRHFHPHAQSSGGTSWLWPSHYGR
jgi:serine/threonine protein phosphatase PrpC